MAARHFRTHRHPALREAPVRHYDAVDIHQRRVWQQMIDAVDAYRRGDLKLAKFVDDLPGFLQAAEVRDRELVDGFWSVYPAIESELELRTEAWAPPNLASDEHLAAAVDRFAEWTNGVLTRASHERQ